MNLPCVLIVPDDVENDLRQSKRRMRAEAIALRTALLNGDELSRRIFEHLAAMPEYIAAKTVMSYLDTRGEVHTQAFIEDAWRRGQRIVVPYCLPESLGLFCLERLDELSPGTMGILEPRHELRDLADRRVSPDALDFIITPGVAFDRRGNRLGYGKGYYDRLLHQVRGDAMKAGVCYECQMMQEIPTAPHDVRMDAVVTEQGVTRPTD